MKVIKDQVYYLTLSIISILMPDFLKFRHFQAGGFRNTQKVGQFSNPLFKACPVLDNPRSSELRYLAKWSQAKYY